MDRCPLPVFPSFSLKWYEAELCAAVGIIPRTLSKLPPISGGEDCKYRPATQRAVLQILLNCAAGAFDLLIWVCITEQVSVPLPLEPGGSFKCSALVVDASTEARMGIFLKARSETLAGFF